jgi:F-type H+-transporting ATPase subunit delta
MFSGSYRPFGNHRLLTQNKPSEHKHVSADQPLTAGVAGRYATALFELADQAGALDTVAGDLKGLNDLIEESDDLKRLVRSPVFSAEDQTAAMKAIMAKTGTSALAQNFVGVVIRNRRFFVLQDMIRAFNQILAKARGEMTATVTSAHPLADTQTAALKEALNAAMGRDVQIETNVDKGLLGGLVVKVGSRMIDSSLRTKLNNLKFAMKEAG